MGASVVVVMGLLQRGARNHGVESRGVGDHVANYSSHIMVPGGGLVVVVVVTIAGECGGASEEEGLPLPWWAGNR